MRYIKVAFCVFALLWMCAVPAVADDMSESAIRQSGIYESAAALDKQTKKFLNDIGLSEITAESIYRLDFSNFVQTLLSALRVSLSENVRYLLVIIGAVFLAAFADAMGSGLNKGKHARVFGICAVLLISITAVAPLSRMLAQAGGAVETAGSFSIAAIPVLCVVVAAQGKSISAAVVSGSALGISQVLSTLFSTFFLPLNHILLGVGISASLESSFGIEKIIALVRKYLLIGLSICALIYFTVLSLRCQIGSAVDETTLKTIRFASSNFVPVIGSAVSDSAVAVAASLGVTKNAIGIFGLFCIIGIFIPLLCKVLVWLTGLELAAVVGDVFGMEQIQKSLKNLAAALSVLMVIIIFCMLIFLMNFGVLIQLRGAS